MFNDGRAGVAGIVDRPEADEQPVVAALVVEGLDIIEHEQALCRAQARDLRGPGFAGNLQGLVGHVGGYKGRALFGVGYPVHGATDQSQMLRVKTQIRRGIGQLRQDQDGRTARPPLAIRAVIVASCSGVAST